MTGNWYMAWLEEGVYQILQRCAKYSMKNEEEKNTFMDEFANSISHKIC